MINRFKEKYKKIIKLDGENNFEWLCIDHNIINNPVKSVICPYVFFFSLEREYGPSYNLILFSLTFYLFSYKTLFLENKSMVVHEVRGSFRCTRSKPTGCRILGDERNQIFLSMQGCFFSKNSVYALQPRLYLSSPNLFFSCAYCML